MEDAARFALDDETLCRELKAVRHGLQDGLAMLPPGWLEAGRDTAGDVGTSIEAPGEMRRRGLADVVIAAGKRFGEALRVMEETAKVVDAALARRLEALRYRFYDIEPVLQRRLAHGRRRQWRVCVLLTEAACATPWPDVLAAALDGGADCIQVREKNLDAAALLERTGQVVERAHAAGAAVIVNDRADVALAAGADGVHVGRDDLAPEAIRRISGWTLVVGASTHDLDEAAAAVEAGADYCGVGAMFASSTKAAAPAGPAYLRAFIDRYPEMAHLAIGGVTAENVGLLAEAGARGVAVCAAVCGAERPGRVVAALREAIEAGAVARRG